MKILPPIFASLLLLEPGFGVILFSHDFENATAGAVDSVADLGTPAAGTFEFLKSGPSTDAPAGAISSTRPAFMLGHRNGATPASNGFTNMSSLPNAAVSGALNPINFYTVSSGLGATTNGTSLRANFASAAEISPGNSVNVDFDIGSFGNNNPGKYKLLVVTGLDPSGNALFNLVYQAGSSSQTRELYVSNGYGGSQGSFVSVDITSLTTSIVGGVDRVLNGSSFAHNSTDATTSPSSMLSISLNFEFLESEMTDVFTVGLDGNGSTLDLDPNINDSFALDYNDFGGGPSPHYNSLAALDFTVIWNRDVDSENKGLWVDNIFVESVPEPSVSLFLLFAALPLKRRSRK